MRRKDAARELMDTVDSSCSTPAFNAAMLTRPGGNKGAAAKKYDQKLALGSPLDPSWREA
jgi:hypothetical protein